MTVLRRWLGRLALSAAVLGVVAFGSVQATAGMFSSECPVDPPTHLGYCSPDDPGGCERNCSIQGPYQGLCIGDLNEPKCCICIAL